ncbi:MAG: S9 family peptidase [Kordiimonadaceae bacterium]|nr:S9 family peptidase [Kordiimonadaceae bacterium]
MLTAPEKISPPKAGQKPYRASHHGYTRSDPWFWLRDPKYPDVTDTEILAYLKEENGYFDAVMAPEQDLTKTLFEEIKGRVKEDDASVPWQEGRYDFKWAFEQGSQYRSWYYRPRTDNPHTGGGWQLLFDEAKAAEGKEFFKLSMLCISPNGERLAYSVDDNGSERFTIRVKCLKSGQLLDDVVAETSGDIVWGSDSNALVYVKVSKEWRPYLVAVHSFGEHSNRTLYEEQDTAFFVRIESSTSSKYLVIRTGDHVTAENHLVPLANLSATPLCLAPRREKHDYYVDHAGQGLFIRSNKDHKNYCIYALTKDTAAEADWQLVIEGTDTRYLHGMQVFDGFVAVEDRLDGLDQLYIWSKESGTYVALPEPVYEVSLGGSQEPTQDFVRLNYSSLITPPAVYDYGVGSGQLLLRKEQEIPSGYEKAEYRSERMMVTARDGAQVPVSIVYHKSWKKGAGTPLHLYGYGAYGLGMSPSFSAARLSLLDRGFAYAIAHIRGGDEMGYGWYEAGKLDQRENTFNDFVDVARTLTEGGYATEGGISISGGSAGGELMGAVLNQAPELFKGAAMHVPFVDVLNTMLDGDLPLTPIEWPEWGNPVADKPAYEMMAAYCPYSNLEPKNYPPMLVTGGLNDPRVTYWEPAKWVAKLRDLKTDDHLLMLKINMGAGHGGKSGRFERLFEVAEEYTFLLMCFGQNNK